jgi:endonuclease YncB( thermonuclease family)
MKAHYWKISICFFLGIMLFGVKGLHAKSNLFEVMDVISGHELELKELGKIRLAGLLYETQLDAADILSDLLKDSPRVKVEFLSQKPDRYGRKSAHIYLKDGRWLQGELVRQGLARVYPYEGESPYIRDLYILEDMARKSKAGHWNDEDWHVISALDDGISRDSFQIIDGVVVDVAEVKGSVYLNFGNNWRTDFTAMITKQKLKGFKRAGFELSLFKGRHLRVRGWVFERNGPMISADDPLQFQFLD